MTSGKNTWELRVKAWWVRNFRLRPEDLLTIQFYDDYKPNLFEVLATNGGACVLYLGKNKYKQIN